MMKYDAQIDRQSIRGLDGVEVARMISARPRSRKFPKMDERLLRDIGLSDGAR